MKIYALSMGLDSSGHPYIAWHWPWSLTWSWGIWFRRGASGRLGFYHLPTYGREARHCGLNTPLFSFTYQSQPTMRRAEMGKGDCGDFLRVTAQGKALRDAEWRPMLSCVVDVPDTIKNRQAFYVGRRVQIQLAERYMKCLRCDKPMMPVYVRYETRDGRTVQAEAQYRCSCGTKVTVNDTEQPTMSRSESSAQT